MIAAPANRTVDRAMLTKKHKPKHEIMYNKNNLQLVHDRFTR